MKRLYQQTLRLLRPAEQPIYHAEEFTAVRKIGPSDLLRVSIGIVYMAFGILKFFPHYSPAEDLAEKTIAIMTFGVIEGTTALYMLAIMETIIGIALIARLYVDKTILMAFFHMGCTFLPMIILPHLTFTNEPSSLSLIGQYILKNIVIISALYLIYYENRQKFMDSQ